MGVDVNQLCIDDTWVRSTRRLARHYVRNGHLCFRGGTVTVEFTRAGAHANVVDTITSYPIPALPGMSLTIMARYILDGGFSSKTNDRQYQ